MLMKENRLVKFSWFLFAYTYWIYSPHIFVPVVKRNVNYRGVLFVWMLNFAVLAIFCFINKKPLLFFASFVPIIKRNINTIALLFVWMLIFVVHVFFCFIYTVSKQPLKSNTTLTPWNVSTIPVFYFIFFESVEENLFMLVYYKYYILK